MKNRISIAVFLLLMHLGSWAQIGGDYNPTNPSDPGNPTQEYTLSLKAMPSNGGSFNTTSTNIVGGKTYQLRAYPSSDFAFVAWLCNGDTLSKSSSYTYTMPYHDVEIIGMFTYSPSNPSDPNVVAQKYTLTMKATPSEGGSFNVTSTKVSVGERYNLRAYPNTDFAFVAWLCESDTLSKSASYDYTMPSHNVDITGVFTYRPSNPTDPQEQALKYQLSLVATPMNSGSFNISNERLAVGSNNSLRAYANTDFVFKHWIIGDSVLSTNPNMDFVMPSHNVQMVGVFEYNPASPANPNRNHWDKQTGEVVVDDFTPGNLSSAISSVISGSSRNDVAMIIVAGRMNDNDFGIANNYENCTLLDLSRVTGVSEIPSYAFDYTNLETVYLPATIEVIGYRAFADCQNLSSLTCYAMTPPVLEDYVFKNVPEGLVVYVPAAAIAQYQDAEGWKNFTILPIQEDIRSVSISLPEGANAADYAQMWLELTNTKSGQRMHYVMTDRTQYTFANIIRNTSWNVVLRNERGDIFGQIDNVEVKDEDVSVAFTSLSKPQSVVLSVLTHDGQDVTAQTQITWMDSQGNYLAQGVSLTGLPTGYQIRYSVVLPQELAMTYITPQPVDYALTDGNNRITCKLNVIPQVKISGKVKDVSTGLPVSKAVISASQTFGGKYSKTLNAKTGGNGEFMFDIANVPTSIAFAASDYISQTVNCDSLLVGVGAVTLPDVLLKTITGATITVDFTYTTCDGETQNWYSDYQNVNYSLFNITKNRAVSQYNVQYPQIVLLEEIEDGDVLRLTATSRTNAFMPVETTTTIAEQKAEATFGIVELGQIHSSFVTTGNASVVGSLYDEAGKLVKTYDYANASLTISKLADGNYTLVTMGSSRLFNTIYDLAQLPQTGLSEGSDYVLNTVEVKSGQVSAINISEVPTLDESKLYYTGDNTSFTVNKPSIVAGNYLTLTGRLDFKQAYVTKVSNVQMIVDLPESCEFVENSVMVGNSTSSYTLNGNRITIPMTRYTDRVRFCVIPTVGGDYAPNAFAQFDIDGKTVTQPIGSANYTAKDLTISVPSTVAKTIIPVSGTAIGTSNVEIYDNGVLIGQTTSLANGTWATTCELDEPYNLSTHSIYAKVTNKQGLELQSETRDCVYDMNAIEVRAVTMSFYNGWLRKNVEVVFDFENNKTSDASYMFYTGTDITFVADLTNNDTTVVSDVKIYVFTDKDEVRELPAVYDAKNDKWVAVSRFESNNLPINVSVDYVAQTPTVIDSYELDASRKDLENISDSYNQILARLEDAKSDETGEEMKNLLVDLGLVTDSIVDEEMMVFNAMLDSMTDEEFEAYGDVLDKEITAFLDNNQGFTNSVLKELNVTQDFDFSTDDGAKMLITNDSAYVEEDLLLNGYEQIYLTNGGSIYYLETDSVFRVVDLINHTVVEIQYSKDALNDSLSDEERAKYRSRDVAILIRNAILGVNEAVQTIKGFHDDLMNRLLQSEDEIRKAGKAIDGQLNKALNYFNRSKNPLKQTYWMSKIIAIQAQKVSNSLALSIANQCRPLIRKVIPILDYIDMTNKLIADINTAGDLYLSIPEPCPNDQSDADIYAAQSLSLIGVFAGYATGRILLRAQGDAKIAGGIVAALPSGGTSLLASLWGLIDKVVIGMALDFAYEKTRNYAIQSIRNNIATLECYKECPKCGKNPCICKTPPPPLEPVSPIHDPSGYVYEGVSSNRVEGVMASCYYKETVEDMYGDLHENVVLWDAEQYAQENPLFTDENGMYRWDVPQGLWQVKFEKEGYETTYSEWLPVPPPQLEVNIPMKQNVQPNVKSARAFENAVEVQFDKYMMPEMLTTENIMVLADENVVEGTIELLDEEFSYEGKSDKYASKIRFNAKEPFSAEEVTLIVKNRVKSYAGIRMQDDYSQNFTVELEIRKIECDSVLAVIYGEQSTIMVQVHPASAAEGKTLKVNSLAPLLLSVDKNAVTLDAGGKAEITISGDLPGTAALMFEVDGHDISATSIVKIGNMESLMVATPTTSIASGSEVAAGTEIYLSCATENAAIYYTLDGTCPCENTSSVIRYDGTPIVINETTTIKAIAYAEGMYESEVATFVYTVNNGSGIDEEKTGKYTVYPQLVKDIVNIDIPEDVSANVCIASVHGQTVYERKNMTGHNTVDMTGLTKGMYVVAIRNGDELVSIKIIKIGN